MEREGPPLVFVTVCHRPYPQPHTSSLFFNMHFNIIFSSTPASRKISQVFHLVFCTTHLLSPPPLPQTSQSFTWSP